jgi:hypothetical protein
MSRGIRQLLPKQKSDSIKRPEFLWLNIAQVQRYKTVIVKAETERMKSPEF